MGTNKVNLLLETAKDLDKKELNKQTNTKDDDDYIFVEDINGKLEKKDDDDDDIFVIC